ncbi:MAG: hypothetical protein K8F30_01455 [Taibaiella sp.]|nr:hypothetical protein [Taibaiella sp.]
MSLRVLVLTFFVIGVIGCAKNNSPDAEIPNNFFSTFPMLKQTNDSSCKLIRSVFVADIEVELKLYKLPDNRGDIQKLVVVTNGSGKQYVIPLFSNFYRDYWDFDNGLAGEFPGSNSTFCREFNRCLSILELDTIGKTVFSEMIFSLLHCQKLNDVDSAGPTIYMVENSNYPYETTDGCFQRMKRDWRKIVDRLYPQGRTTVSYPVYQDGDNKRIYQLIDSAHFSRKGFSIIVYRTDCNEALLHL